MSNLVLKQDFNKFLVPNRDFYRIPVSVFKQNLDYFTSLYSLTEANKNLLIFNFTDDLTPEETEPQVIIKQIIDKNIIEEIYPS